jgi:drug/metabolite transporter (DMT)-like permease
MDPAKSGSNRRRPVVYLIAAMLMLSSFAPVIKQILLESGMPALDLTCLRLGVGWVFLSMMAATWDRQEISLLTPRDVLKLAALGVVGVGIPYAVAVWSLVYTTVTHYVLIYSLTPAITAGLSTVFAKERMTRRKSLGIVCSVMGCLVAVTEGLDDVMSFARGDALALLFSILIAGFLVGSTQIVKRYGAMTANTVMFGSSFLLLIPITFGLAPPPPDPLSLSAIVLILYVGMATAAVFLLRYLALQSLSPSTVGAFHNFVPVVSIGMAALLLGEALDLHTIIGGAGILAGVEMVRRG